MEVGAGSAGRSARGVVATTVPYRVPSARLIARSERLPPGAMVILDELCSGTNPSEGEEIFELVVTLLTELRPQAFVTTHFLTFAERLERGGRVDALRTLQVELGAGERPTYQFVPGVAKTSLAHRAAERLGVTRDELKSLVERSTARAKPSASTGAKGPAPLGGQAAKLGAASPARAPEKVS